MRSQGMKKRRYDHIIWDWNGTLFDDSWLSVEVINQVLTSRGMQEITPKRYSEIFDFPVIEYYRRLGFDFRKESFEKVGTEFITKYELRRHECKLREGAAEMLSEIAADGIGQSILSAYKQETLDELLEYFHLRRYFDIALGHSDHYASGKSETGRKLRSMLAHDGDRVLFVGDTVHDYEVALEMGTDCVLIPSGHQPLSKLESCGATVIRSLKELSSIIAG